MLLLLGIVAMAGPVTLYVSPNGNDRWSGSAAKPNATRTDGPFATIVGARNFIRTRRLPNEFRVVIQPGVYRVTEPITFGPEDSPRMRCEYLGPRAVDPLAQPAIVSGMRPIAGWTKLPNGHWQAKVEPGWVFSQLFVNGERRYRPRLPKRGYYKITDQIESTPEASGHGYDRFRFTPGEIKKEWNFDDVELLVFHIWGMSRNRIRSVDANLVTFRAPTGYPDAWADLRKGNRFIVENVKEALSEPGEWFLDRKADTVTYVPKPGESLDRVKIEAPVATSLIRFEGTRNIHVRGLQLEGTNWNLGPAGRNFPQAEADLHGAVTLENSSDCTFAGCGVRHVGEYGIEVGAGCEGIFIMKNNLFDLGAGGVKVGTMAWDRGPKATGHVNVDVNTITSGGRLHPAAVGVWVGQNAFVHVEGNTISDLYYTGISVGWSWGYQPNGAHDNTIVANRISDIGQGVLSDMGGIYTLGPQSGTLTIRGNRIHDVQSFAYGGWGIYPDEGSTGILIEKNCVFRTKSAGFHQHYGKENVIRNNVFAYGGEAQIMRTRAEDHLSLTFEHNIVLFKDAPLLGGNWSGNNYRFDHNLYFGQPLDFGGLTLEAWRAKGQDEHSIVQRPPFKDPEHGNFALTDGALATQIGFKPFPALEASYEGRKPVYAPRAFP